MADGRKLKPFVAFESVRLNVELMQCPGVVVMMSRNRWMNEDLTVEYLDRMWGHLTIVR